MRILIIEDDRFLVDVMKIHLTGQTFAVDTAYTTGETGEELARSHFYDLILLDVKLPAKDGFEVCRSLRQENISTPVIMITGHKMAIEDRVNGLDTGADDYLIKPFHMEELSARTRAVLRREPQIIPSILRSGNLVLDSTLRQVTCEGKEIHLTGREYAILEYLMRHAGANVSRNTLEQHVWDETLDSSSNMLDVNIHRLRQKIGDLNENLIQTVRGFGFRITPPA